MNSRSMESAGVFLATLVFVAMSASPSAAEVRFGKNVRVGGHDVSGRTFNSQQRGAYYVYEGQPPIPGCRTVKNRDGSTTKVCHLQRKRP
jgi:hypothetical protein